MARSIRVIAREIVRDYADKGKPVTPFAKPYVDAMLTMDTVADGYGAESGEYVILYGLHNLSGWRGDKAREVKAELKEAIAEHRKANPRR
jgi:hypothetical protein